MKLLVIVTNWYNICSVQSRNLRNLKIALCILRIRKLCANLEITRHWCAISRSHNSVACTIEPFEFPLCTKVRNVCNELLQLLCHHQCRACILKPLHQGLPGSLPTQGNSLSLGLGMGAESSQTCGVSSFKASSSRRALNYLPAQTLSPR